jgi:uroporphyrinogen decarboxylase
MVKSPDKGHKPDWEAFVQCLKRAGTPRRVHFIEIYLDEEVKQALCARYDLLDGLDAADPYFLEKREIRIQRFLGYDYVLAGLENFSLSLRWMRAEDVAELKRASGRLYIDEHTGPITNWQEFEAYPWPDPQQASVRALEWYERNLPDDMCVLGGLTGHFAEELSWLMGYETLCLSLYDQRDLVRAISERLIEMYRQVVALLLQFERVKAIWGTDDMGFRSGTLISPDDLREFVLPGHKLLAQMCHDAGRLYLLHSCGNLSRIMRDLVEDVRIDAKHSFEDTIEDVRDAKKKWGEHIALLGGIDMDFLCRSDEAAIRARVRDTLDVCLPGGGYLLGTGNSVANYIPLDHYLAMMDEGWKYQPWL